MTSFLALRASVCVSNSPGMLFLFSFFFFLPPFLGGGLIFPWYIGGRLQNAFCRSAPFYLLRRSQHSISASGCRIELSKLAEWPRGPLISFLTPVRAQFCTGASSDSNPRFWPDGRRVGCSRHGHGNVMRHVHAHVHVVIKKNKGLPPSLPLHALTGQSWTRARSPPRAVCRARAVCLCQRPLPPIDRLWADSCERFSVYRWWPVAGTGLPEVAAHDGCDATDTPRCC